MFLLWIWQQSATTHKILRESYVFIFGYVGLFLALIRYTLFILGYVALVWTYCFPMKVYPRISVSSHFTAGYLYLVDVWARIQYIKTDMLIWFGRTSIQYKLITDKCVAPRNDTWTDKLYWIPLTKRINWWEHKYN